MFIQNAHAETQTFEGWLKNGESATTDKQSFLLQISAAQNKVWADYGTGALQVSNNSCDQTETAKLCVDNIEYVLPDRRHRAYVRLYALFPKITIKREFASTNLIIGNKTVVTVTLKNEGDVAATKVTYTDPLTNDIEVTDISGGFAENGVITWTGVIKAGETKEITYKIIPKEVMDRKFSAQISYFDGFAMKTFSSTETALKVTPFAAMNSRIFGRSNIYIGEIFNYTINISNLDSHPVNFEFLQVRIDKGLKIIELPSDLKKVDDLNYRYENWKILENRSKIFRLKIRGERISESNVYATAAYAGFDGKKRALEEQKSSVKTEDKGITIRTNLNEKAVEEKDTQKISILISNNNPAASLKNVFVSTSSDLAYLPNAYFPELAQSGSQRIEKTIIIPNVSVQRGFKVNVNVTYTTEFGDTGSKLETSTITVVPIKDLVITQTLDKTSIESGEPALVTIKVENPRLVKVNQISVKSAIPEDFIISGATSNNVDIYSKEIVNVLTFFITAPKVKIATKFNITTDAYYSDGKIYRYNATTGIIVNPKKLDLVLTKTVDEADVYAGEPFYVTYSIKNPSEDQEAKNITLKFPLQQEFDNVGLKTSYIIPELRPGEIVYLYSKEHLRAKYNETLSINKTIAHYINEDGAEFTANSSEVSFKVKTSYKKGPYLIIGKEIPKDGNNLESFDVVVRAKNIGDDYATAQIEDGIHKWSVLLDAGAEKTFQYKMRIITPGMQNIEQAVASYSYGNISYITGSNKANIIIQNKPLIILSRKVPEKGNNVDNINVSLSAKNLLGKELRNITVMDGLRTWKLDELNEEKIISYPINFTDMGSHTLEKATATYTFEGDIFEVASEENAIAIEEKKIASLEKTAPAEAEKNKEFIISITALNSGDKDIKNAVIRDSAKEFFVNISAGGRKTVSYPMKLNESASLKPAYIDFEYNGRSFEEFSNSVNILIQEEKAQETSEKKSKGPLDAILNFIIKILSWKRG